MCRVHLGNDTWDSSMSERWGAVRGEAGEGRRSQVMGGPGCRTKKALRSYERTLCRDKMGSDPGFRKITSVNNDDNKLTSVY